jgi:uncharacterized protein YjbI with pentapeptide repeats
MTPEETLTLLAEGRDAWNAWAKEMLAGRAELEAARKWAVGWEEGLNSETRNWLEKARADFSAASLGRRQSSNGQPVIRPKANAASRTRKTRHLQLVASNGVMTAAAVSRKQSLQLSAENGIRQGFSEEIDFSDYIFPGDADFRGVRFEQISQFNNVHFHGDVSFAEAQFSGRADFSGASFEGDALFHGAVFSEAALFCGVRAKGETEFDRAQFHGDALFDRAQFFGVCRFHKTHFMKYADFFAVLFSGAVVASHAQFSLHARFGRRQPWAPEGLGAAEFRGDADFSQSRFEDAADFTGVKFAAGANFKGVACEREFLLAKTAFAGEVPDFVSTSFKNPPHLQGMTLDASLPPGGFWRSIFKAPHDPELCMRYRALRRMAGRAHDASAQERFRRSEMRCRRGGEDKLWRPPFLLGLAYDALSDFGASVTRPLLIWALSIIFFACAYLGSGAVVPSRTDESNWLVEQWDFISGAASGDLRCFTGNGNPVMEAAYLSWKNALVIGLWSSVGTREINACLYGGASGGDAVPTAVSILELVQAAWSAALIALAVLAFSRRFSLR